MFNVSSIFDEGSGFSFRHFGCVRVDFSTEAGGKVKKRVQLMSLCLLLKSGSR